MPGARIFSFTYDSRVFSDNAMAISDYALELLASISSKRTTRLERSRAIVFVCHSLGGLVTKKVLLISPLSDPTSEDVILILDGLDECSEDSRYRLLDLIIQVSAEGRIADGRLKILLTSRPQPTVQAKLRGPWVNILRVEDEMRSLESDMKRVISTKVAQFGYSERLTDDVTQYLVRNAEGSFLWVSIVLQLLEESGDSSYRGVMDILRGSSRGSDLFNLYRGILDRIPAPYRTRTRRALQIVVTALRPLTLVEFSIAFAIDYREPHDDTRNVEATLQKDLPNLIRQLCGPLIRTVNGRVHLVHQTMRAFLLAAPSGYGGSIWDVDPVESHLHIARICIWYLRSRAAAPSSRASGSNDRWGVGGDLPDGLLTYASTYWLAHFTAAGDSVGKDDISNASELHRLTANSSRGSVTGERMATSRQIPSLQVL
ncbi:hypothetical protein VUR80DRAFT_10314 [Thermomyces stellatus]